MLGRDFFKLEGAPTNIDRQDDFFKLAENKGRIFAKVYLPTTLESPYEPQRALVSDCDFEEVSFSKTQIENIEFKNCTFKRCLFIGAKLKRCRFTECSFTETNTYRIEFEDGFKPKQEYCTEMQDSVWLLKYLQAQQTECWTSLCGADIAYVSVRNIGISMLASRGVYEFAFLDVLKCLRDHGLVSTKQVETIGKLRKLKFCYRTRVEMHGVEATFRHGLEAALSLISSSGNDQFRLREPSLLDGYRWLRWLEFNLVSRLDPRVLDALPVGNSLSPVWRLIRDPRNYPDRPRKYDLAWMLDARESSLLALNEMEFLKQ